MSDTATGIHKIGIENSRFDKNEAASLSDRVSTLLEQGVKNFDFDLSKSDFIDSAGVGKLLFLNKKITLQRGSLTISSIHPALYRLLDSLGITEVMKMKKI